MLYLLYFFIFLNIANISYALPESLNHNSDISIKSYTNNLVVTQTSDRSIIDWKQFDISKSEHIKFNQPNSYSHIINRINNGSSTNINGQITANGKISILNPNGILFNKDSKINVGGLIATTSNIDDELFLKTGKLHFSPFMNRAPSFIRNEGNITIENSGMAMLVAPHIVNDGVIKARLGNVQLANFNNYVIDFYGDGLINFMVQNETASYLKPEKRSISNNGNISANDIYITAATAEHIIENIISINNSITTTQKIKTTEAGTIEITNQQVDNSNVNNSTLFINSDLIANSDNGKGGKINLFSNNINIGRNLDNLYSLDQNLNDIKHILLDVSGKNEGGQILIGGEYQGKSNNNAKDIFISSNVTLRNNAKRDNKIKDGIGNDKIIIWSDQINNFFGNIESKGLDYSYGGFAEISGKKRLITQNMQYDISANINLSSKDYTKFGSVLFDPEEITILGSYTPETDNDLINFSVLTIDANNDKNYINYAALNSSVSKIGDYIISTSNDLSSILSPGDMIRVNSSDLYIIDSITNNSISTLEPISLGYKDNIIERLQISLLYDASYNGNNLIQNDKNYQPHLRKNGSLYSLKFDGDDFLYKKFIPFNADMSIFMLLKPTNSNNRETFLDLRKNDNGKVRNFALEQNTIGSSGNRYSFISSNNYYDTNILLDNSNFQIIKVNANTENNSSIISNTNMNINGVDAKLLRISGSGLYDNINLVDGVMLGALNNDSLPTKNTFFNGEFIKLLVYNKQISADINDKILQHLSILADVNLYGSSQKDEYLYIMNNSPSYLTKDFIEKISKQGDIIIKADKTINLDLQSKILNVTPNNSFELESPNINIKSTSTIQTNRIDQLNSNTGNITLKSTNNIYLNSDLTLDADGGGEVRILANHIFGSGKIKGDGTGTINISTVDTNKIMGIGSKTDGDLILSDSFLDNIKTHWDNYKFGATNGGKINISYYALDFSNLKILSNNDINIMNTITTGKTAYLSGDNINIFGSINGNINNPSITLDAKSMLNLQGNLGDTKPYQIIDLKINNVKYNKSSFIKSSSILNISPSTDGLSIEFNEYGKKYDTKIANLKTFVDDVVKFSVNNGVTNINTYKGGNIYIDDVIPSPSNAESIFLNSHEADIIIRGESFLSNSVRHLEFQSKTSLESYDPINWTTNITDVTFGKVDINSNASIEANGQSFIFNGIINKDKQLLISNAGNVNFNNEIGYDGKPIIAIYNSRNIFFNGTQNYVSGLDIKFVDSLDFGTKMVNYGTTNLNITNSLKGNLYSAIDIKKISPTKFDQLNLIRSSFLDLPHWVNNIILTGIPILQEVPQTGPPPREEGPQRGPPREEQDIQKDIQPQKSTIDIYMKQQYKIFSPENFVGRSMDRNIGLAPINAGPRADINNDRNILREFNNALLYNQEKDNKNLLLGGERIYDNKFMEQKISNNIPNNIDNKFMYNKENFANNNFDNNFNAKNIDLYHRSISKFKYVHDLNIDQRIDLRSTSLVEQRRNIAAQIDKQVEFIKKSGIKFPPPIRVRPVESSFVID